MKRLVIQALIFTLPFAAVLAVEVFLLPIDAFTFRHWEAMDNGSPHKLFEGPFYPSVHLEAEEHGAEGYRTSLGGSRFTVAETDRHGFRYSPSSFERFDVVIIGDSNTVGSYLDQSETLSRLLEECLGTGVYPFARAGIKEFYRSERFRKSPPKVVLLAPIERVIQTIEFDQEKWDRYERKPKAKFRAGIRRISARWPWFQELLVIGDRLRKQALYHYCRAELSRSVERGLRTFFGMPERFKYPVAVDRSMIFFQGSEALVPLEAPEAERVLRDLKAFQAYLRRRGTELLFMPIPNKETVYFDKVPGADAVPPTGLEDFISQAREAGIPTIDLQSAYERFRRRSHELLFFRDDSHWTPVAVEIAASLADPVIEAMLSGASKAP
jgi:alginate O-acetyltransferase complex protein AlgJ